MDFMGCFFTIILILGIFIIYIKYQDKKINHTESKNPDNYKHLVVRVAGYSALFTTLSKSLQDDIINRTEQGW